MNPVFKMRTIDSDPSDRESHKQDDAEPGCPTISLLSFLEAENIRLRQAVVELSLETMALREVSKRMETPNDRVANFRSTESKI
jgi:hypothetical protein